MANSPLPPMSDSRSPVACVASPVVRIACSWNTSSPRSTGQNLVSSDRNSRVCTSASGEARVPTRSGSPWWCGRTRGGRGPAGCTGQDDSSTGFGGVSIIASKNPCFRPPPRPRPAPAALRRTRRPPYFGFGSGTPDGAVSTGTGRAGLLVAGAPAEYADGPPTPGDAPAGAPALTGVGKATGLCDRLRR